MSGVAGIVRLDAGHIERSRIERMVHVMAARGPAGQAVWLSESVALGHAALITTAEARRESLPLAEGALAIVADVRLDNRAQLGALLQHVLAGPVEALGDGALILAAYREWGAACVTRLEGDFAFAIWDGQARSLFCARDPFGVKQFVYAEVPNALFAFGSEVRALLALEQIPRDVDESRVADFLALYFDQPERTFYRAIKRLPGGCTLTLDAARGTVSIDRYWSLDRVEPFTLRGGNRDAQYAEGFREHFTRAVRERMRVETPSQIGSMLSGGLDSSYITCVARDELRRAGAAPLPAFSWIFSDSMDADERDYQHAVIAAGGLRPVTLDSQALAVSPWTDIDALLASGPVYAPNHYLNSVAAAHARRGGVKVMLDGVGGDSTVSHGRARLIELLVHGRLRPLAAELRSMAARRNDGRPLWRLFLAHVAAPLLPASLIASTMRLRGRQRAEDPGLHLLTPRMIALSGASSARQTRAFSAREEHRLQLESPMLAEGLDIFDRTVALHGIETRYPFFDRRLAEYCLSLPADQKLSDGYTRMVARRAMAGTVPDAIRWRAGKGAPGLHVVQSLRRNRGVLDDLFLRDASVLERYVRIDVLRTTYSRFLSEDVTDFKTVIRLWSVAVLARWLRL